MPKQTHTVVNAKPKLFTLAGLATLLGFTPPPALPDKSNKQAKNVLQGRFDFPSSLSDKAYRKRKVRMKMARESRRSNR